VTEIIDGLEVMTIPEVADYLKVSRAQVYRLIKSEKLKTFHVGANTRVLKRDLNEYIDRSKN